MIGYLGLGSNLGNRFDALANALGALAGVLQVQKVSFVYETIPEGNANEPLYLNAALRIATNVRPEELMRRFLAIESEQGRVRHATEPKGPRIIDIDLLLYGDLVMDDPVVQVPHPRLLTRPFVRIPLADVALPGLRHPITFEPLDEVTPDANVLRVVGLNLEL